MIICEYFISLFKFVNYKLNYINSLNQIRHSILFIYYTPSMLLLEHDPLEYHIVLDYINS